jgi:hypothetical protein
VSEVDAQLVAAGGTVIGAAVGGLIALRATLPYRKQRALNRQTALVAARLETYRKVLEWMRPYFDNQGKALEVSVGDRQEHVRRLRDWYYEGGAGLLLSGNAFNAYRDCRSALLDPRASSESVAKALSLLRTELKIDIGSREPKERYRQFAPSVEQEEYVAEHVSRVRAIIRSRLSRREDHA